MSTITDWRQAHNDAEGFALALEAKAIDLGLPDGFTISPGGNTISWFRWGNDALPDGDERTSLQEFADRVKLVAAALGRAPDEVDTDGGSEKLAPNLRAVWRVPFKFRYWSRIEVKVITFSPTDCRLHPNNHYTPSTYIAGHDADIHPECAAVLRGLEDLEPETI